MTTLRNRTINCLAAMCTIAAVSGLQTSVYAQDGDDDQIEHKESDSQSDEHHEHDFDGKVRWFRSIEKDKSTAWNAMKEALSEEFSEAQIEKIKSAFDAAVGDSIGAISFSDVNGELMLDDAFRIVDPGRYLHVEINGEDLPNSNLPGQHLRNDMLKRAREHAESARKAFDQNRMMLIEAGERNAFMIGLHCLTVEQADLDKGLIVTEVVDGSPAAKAGIQRGDVVLGSGEQEYDDVRDLIASVQSAGKSDTLLALHVRRGDDELEIEIKPTKRESLGVMLPHPLDRLRARADADVIVDRPIPAVVDREVESDIQDTQSQILEQIKELREELENLRMHVDELKE